LSIDYVFAVSSVWFISADRVAAALDVSHTATDPCSQIIVFDHRLATYSVSAC